ncbi:S41 family peptidase, partial [Streptomyces sp. NPDC001588]
MSGRDPFCQPRRIRRGAALTLVFASVLVAGAATGSFDESVGKSAAAGSDTLTAEDDTVTEAAARAMADGKSPMEAAERAVSRSGDRWSAVYSQGEYQEFEEALDGQYTGVGLSARRERDGRIEVTRVQPGSPAAVAGIRTGDRLRSVDGKGVDGRPVTEVVALLRGDADEAQAGTRVRLGLQRGAHRWDRVTSIMPSRSRRADSPTPVYWPSRASSN